MVEISSFHMVRLRFLCNKANGGATIDIECCRISGPSIWLTLVKC